jgi:hypothetical protein
MDSKYNKNQKLLLKGTYAWILQTEEFQTFLNAEQQKHLWVQGKPGLCSSTTAITSGPLPED